MLLYDIEQAEDISNGSAHEKQTIVTHLKYALHVINSLAYKIHWND